MNQTFIQYKTKITPGYMWFVSFYILLQICLFSFAVKSIFCARYQDFYSNKFLSNQTIIYPFKKIFGFGSTKQMDNSNLVGHYLGWIRYNWKVTRWSKCGSGPLCCWFQIYQPSCSISSPVRPRLLGRGYVTLILLWLLKV